VRQHASTQRRARPATLFHSEGLAGVFLNELGPAEARRAATALAVLLLREAAANNSPEIVLGCDGRPIAAEITAAASDALRQAGCNVVDAGFTTSAALADSIARLAARGGIYIGCGEAGPQHIAMSFFGERAIPLSAGGGLDQLSRLWHAGFDRPGRSSGKLRRHRTQSTTIGDLSPLFNALRPLRLVLDTTSMPLRRQLARLTQGASLEIIDAGTGIAWASSPDHAVAWASSPCITPAHLPHLSDRIVASSAHFGLWIDGDGVCCRLFDEQGHEIPAERLAAVLLRHFHEQSPDAALVVEQVAMPTVRSVLGRNVTVHAVAAGRESFVRMMLSTGAVAGADQQGRFWFAGGVPIACGLRALAVLLTVLSRSDRPASEAFGDE